MSGVNGSNHEVTFIDKLRNWQTLVLAGLMFWLSFGVSLWVDGMPLWVGVVASVQVAGLAMLLFAVVLPAEGPRLPRVIMLSVMTVLVLGMGLYVRSS